MLVWGLLVVSCGAQPEGGEETVLASVDALKDGTQAYTRVRAAGTIVPGSTVTPVGASITSTRDDAGAYTVNFVGLAPPFPGLAAAGGNIQVTAVGGGSAHCTLNGPWTYPTPTTVRARVSCRSSGGGGVDSGFFIRYSRRGTGDGAYVVVSSAATVAGSTSFNPTGSNTAGTLGTGLYVVSMDGPPTLRNAAIEVTALSASRRCKLATREYTIEEVVVVACFNDAGTPAASAFSLNLAAVNALPLYGVGAYAHVISTGALIGSYTGSSCPESVVTATRTAVGTYQITQTLMSPGPLNFQVAAFGGAPFCKVGSVSGPGATGNVSIVVRCFSADTLADSGFELTLATPASPSTGCGGCGDCQGGSCMYGLCTPLVLASGVAPTSLAANTSDVYWTDDSIVALDAPMVQSVPRGGGPRVTRVTGAGNASSILLDDTSIYWVQSGVKKAPLAGGAATSLLSKPGSAVKLNGMASLGANLYWGDGDTQIHRIPQAGGASTGLLPNPAVPNWYPWTVAVDATNAYFFRDSGYQLYRVPLTGGTPALLWSTPGSVTTSTTALATDGVNVYLATTRSAGNIYRAPVGGGTATLFWTSPGAVISDMAIDGGVLFWTDTTAGKVMSAPLATGIPAVAIASGQNLPRGISVDSTTVFWANADAIMKVAR